MPWENNIVTQLIIQGNNAGLFIYNGNPASGTLIGSWASMAGVDAYGNAYPAGINVLAGSLQGVTITTSAWIGGTIVSTLISAASIQASTMTGGNISESVITFDSGGGGLFLYSTTTTTNTYTTSQQITAPSSAVTSMLIQIWGADAGGGGGNNTAGGEGGGGAEFASEPSYPNYNPGGTYALVIGKGGTGGATNNAGTSGGQSSFDNSVIAGGGLAGSGGFIGGLGGNISTNTIHHAGGNGGSNNVNGYAASAGGGGRAGTTGPGGNGNAPSGNASPGFGGGAGSGTGGIVGSNGVVTLTNGNSGNAGGSGAGQSGGGTTYQSLYYDPTSTASYYGAGVGGGLRNNNGSMFQGDPNVPVTTFPGDQESFANYNYTKIRSDWSGWTIDQCLVNINNQHSWYASGCYCVLGYAEQGTGNHPNVTQFWVPQGQNSGNIDISVFNGVIASSFLAFMLGPSSSTSGGSLDLWNYGYFQGGAGQGGPRLHINGHKGTTGIQYAGNGSNGKAIITYQTSQTLIGAISPVAGTDANGNAYAAGFTGNITAIQPASSPAVLETPHIVSYANSWTKAAAGLDLEYILLGTNTVHISGRITNAGTPSNPSTICTLPTGYQPARQQPINAVENPASPYTGIAHILLVNTNGSVALYGAFTAGNTLNINGVYSLV